jgi:hypothetical protein
VVLTLLGGLLGVVAAEAQQELYVRNIGNNSVTVFSRTASGFTAPLRTLGPAGATGLNAPAGLALTVTASTTPVPTLSEWAQFGMALILVGVAVWTLRRRRRTLGTA